MRIVCLDLEGVLVPEIWIEFAARTGDRLLDALVELQGRDTVAGWQALARAGHWPALLTDLMQRWNDMLASGR